MRLEQDCIQDSVQEMFFFVVLETNVLTIFDIVRNTTLGHNGRTTINEDPMNHSITKVTELGVIL